MQNLKILSQLFSPPVFQKIVREDNVIPFENYTEIIKGFNSFDNNLEIIKFAYKSLLKDYRCEYIYKNNLLINIIKTHGLKSTSILNEFKIGASKADLVMLNGAARVYEIKTELDGLHKLKKQIDDYQKFAEEVNVVTDKKYIRKILSEYKNTSIGIIALNSKNKLEIIQEATQDNSKLNFETIFKLLRKTEYINLTIQNFNLIPELPNTKIFQACYEMLSQIEIKEFQRQVVNKLKERRILRPDLLKSSKTPKELKQICNSLDFNEQEYDRLFNFLATNRICTGFNFKLNLQLK